MNRISISMDLEKLKFYVPTIGFVVLLIFHLLLIGENNRLYPVIERAQQLTSDCINHEQTRVDVFGTEVNRALFLSRPVPTERIVDQ